jgi:RHS repeat-associated protein
MKIKSILTAFAVALAAIAQPALAGFTQDANGNPTHYNGIPIPPMQTVAEARAATEKRLAAIKAEEAKQAAQAATKLATRNSTPATAPQELFFTGKPYLEETGQYLFLFRHYDPELARWTTPDPSGFPDGANNIAYMAVPTSQIDILGLVTISSFSDAWNYWKRENGQSTDSVTAGAAIIEAIKSSGGFKDLVYRIQTQRLVPQLRSVSPASQSGSLADGPYVGPVYIGFVDVIIGRTSISYSDSSNWNALTNFYNSDSGWGRYLKATTMMVADFADIWDFTTNPNDPWWMNLIEEEIPGFIAGPGTPFNIYGVFSHSFDTYAWQPE